MNVVTGLDSQAQAVLIRGLDPIDGEDVMRERRGGRSLGRRGGGWSLGSRGLRFG